MTSPRLYALYCLRAIGLFAIAKYLTRKQLRILCYHSFSIGDEHGLDPVMFIRAQTFERRMQLLRKLRIPVVRLDDAVRRLPAGAICNAETVITFDDGWVSNLTIGAPILDRYGFPASIYVSTEHLDAGAEVFNVALYYLISRSGRERLTLEGLHPQIDGTYDIGKDAKAATVALIRNAERALPVAERQQLLRPIARALDLELDEVLRDGRFQLLSRSEMQQAARRGLDIQLHTHSHRLPDADFEAVAQEIDRNRRMIAEVTGAVPRHFCYPSGQYSGRHPEWLRRLGIISATTCDPGLNNTSSPPLLLKRFLDSERKSDIVFEAEICGVSELLRRMRGRPQPAAAAAHASPAD